MCIERKDTHVVIQVKDRLVSKIMYVIKMFAGASNTARMLTVISGENRRNFETKKDRFIPAMPTHKCLFIANIVTSMGILARIVKDT